MPDIHRVFVIGFLPKTVDVVFKYSLEYLPIKKIKRGHGMIFFIINIFWSTN